MACWLLPACSLLSLIFDHEHGSSTSPEIQVNHWTTRNYIPEHSILLINRRENLIRRNLSTYYFNLSFCFEFPHERVENERYSSGYCKYSCIPCCVSCHLYFGCLYVKNILKLRKSELEIDEISCRTRSRVPQFTKFEFFACSTHAGIFNIKYN